jgi:hypothetical protein
MGLTTPPPTWSNPSMAHAVLTTRADSIYDDLPELPCLSE